MEQMNITKTQLQAALLAWGQEERDGKTKPQQETDALPVAQVADQGTDHLWQKLQEGSEA